MKILFLTHLFPNSSDITKGIFNLSRAKALRKLGHDVEIIAPVCLTPPERYVYPYLKIGKIWNSVKSAKLIPKHEIIEGFYVYHPKWLSLPKRWFWKYEVDLLHLFAGNKISEIVKRFNPDIIISSWLHPDGTYSKYIRRHYNGVIISILEGSDILILAKKYRNGQKILDYLVESVDKIILVSNNMKSDIETSFQIQNVFVLKNGYNSNLFCYVSGNRFDRAKKIRLITVGNLFSVKGHDILLNALKKLDHNYLLTLVGDGILRSEYEDFVHNNDLTDRVRFAGRVPIEEVKNYLSQADIFCMPSRSEGMPAAPLEAMACGLPVIATRVGGLPEMIIDGFNGYLFEPESPESLAQAITRARHTSWDHAGIAKWAAQNYGWDKWAREALEVIGAQVKDTTPVLSA